MINLTTLPDVKDIESLRTAMRFYSNGQRGSDKDILFFAAMLEARRIQDQSTRTLATNICEGIPAMAHMSQVQDCLDDFYMWAHPVEVQKLYMHLFISELCSSEECTQSIADAIATIIGN